MESANDVKKNMINERFRFVFEVLIIFIGIFIFSLIPRYLLPLLVSENSIYYGPLYYSLRALAVILAIPLFLLISNIVLESQKKNVIIEEDLTPSAAHLKLYSFKEGGGFKHQLLLGILILFIIFIPLDFLIYFLIPETLEYTAVSLSTQATDSYLLAPYFIFLISVIIIQISVSIYEESLTRGFLTVRGSEHFHQVSAVLISSLYFGLMHFLYFLNPASKNYPIWVPFIWFLQTLCVGILLAVFIIKKKNIFPIIFAHALNNIISAHAVWNYLQGNDFMVVTLYLYIPLLFFSTILFIWQYPRIKMGFSSGFNLFKTYFQVDERIGESKGDLIFRIFLDFLIGVIILVFALFLV